MSNLHKTTTALVKRASFSAAATAMPNAVTLPEALTHEPPRINTPKAPAVEATKAKERYVKRAQKNQQIFKFIFIYFPLYGSAPLSHARPYTAVPGPWGMPVLGNSWRFAPLVGEFECKYFISNIFVYSVIYCRPISHTGFG